MDETTTPAPHPDDEAAAPRPQYGIGSMVHHVSFGRGRVIGYEDDEYVIQIKGGELRRLPFSYPDLQVLEITGDADLDRIKQAVREVLGDYGWIDAGLELGKRWQGGTVELRPGQAGAQPKEIPIETLFKKIISVRDKLRVLEQKVNGSDSIPTEEKLEFQGYISRAYGSLTSFNALFADKPSQFRGTGKGG